MNTPPSPSRDLIPDTTHQIFSPDLTAVSADLSFDSLPNKDGSSTTLIREFQANKSTTKEFTPVEIPLREFIPQLSIQKVLELDMHSYIRMHSDGINITKAEGPVVHMGFDSEFCEMPNGGKTSVRVLSLQAYIRHGNLTYTHVHYPKGPDKKDRPSFSQFVSEVINGAMDEGVITEPPAVIFIYAHYIRSDAAAWRDFFSFKNEVDSIGGSFASLMKPYGVDIDAVNSKRFKPDPLTLKGEGRKRYRSLVRFVDTLLLTPGYASLEAVGEMLDIPKLVIPEPYSIARMDEYMEANPAGFEEYALRDAEIACEYGLAMHSFARDQLGLNNLPATLGSCAVSSFLKSLMQFEDL